MYVSNITIIDSDTIKLTNAAILLIGPIGINFSEILVEIYTFSFKKCIWKCRMENGGHFVSASLC